MIKKENIKKVIKQFLILTNNSKDELLLLIFIVSFYILFHYPINSLLTNFLIDPCLKYIYAQKWYNDIIYYGLIIILIYRTYKYWHKQYYLNTTYSILFSFTIIYFINRLIGTWNFHSTFLIKSISYCDILFVLSLLSVILIIKTQYSKKQSNAALIREEQFGFITDNPINEKEDDKLQYTNYADTIASKILLTTAKKSFAIGINGKWGTGKTSFFNLIKKNIEANNEVIIIDFSPWNTENFKSIMTDFFETLEEKLINYNSNISKKISDYSEKLLFLNEIETTKPIVNLFKVFFGKNKTLTELKKDLEKNIEKLNKRIIIFIDDLDRLDNSEINEVLKLIRNTANFKNTFFIVAYDRNYVVNSISNLNSYSKEGFLEKIFQLEINLPYYEKEELCKKLYENLKAFFPDKEELLHQSIFVQKKDESINLIHQNIDSMRDVILLSNSLILNYENLVGNVDFSNFLYLEILRIKYPSIYEILKSKNNKFISLDKHKKSFYNLTLDDENYPKLFTTLKSKNNGYCDAINYNNIEGLINELLNKRTNFLSLRNVSKYENYFSYRLLEKTLDENEIKDVLQKDIEIIKRQLTIWINKGYEFDLVKRFSMVTSYRNIENYQNNLKLIFYLANQKSNKSESLIGFDSTIIHNRFGYFESFKKFDYELNSHKIFLTDLMLTYPPFVFESNLIYDFNTRHFNNSQYKFPFEKTELLTIAELYLEKYIEQFPKIDKNLTSLLKSNIISEHLHPNQKHKFSEETTQKVIDYLNYQDLDDIILFLISKNEYNSYTIHPQMYDLIGQKNGLNTYLSERKDTKSSNLYNEFVDFLSKLGSGNHAIEFEFKKINI